MSIRFDDQVAIVTGAGGGIGKEHALELARRGAKVVVNDLGGSVDGSGTSDAAEAVVQQIKDAGGEAMANGASNLVMDVHFQGTLNCTHTIYPIMREQGYGRIVFTSSSSGVYGNFGQSNYGAAKMAIVGLMNTLKIEGQKYNVFSNSITPVAYTRMTEGLIPEDFGKNLQPEYVTPAVIYLSGKDAPNGVIIAAGAGVYARIITHETMGVSLGTGEDMTPENIAANWDTISDMDDARALQNGGEQTLKIFELISKQ